MKKSLGVFYHQQEDDYGEGEDDAEVQQECLHKFSTRDYIMEPSIFNTLKRCVRKGTGMRGGWGQLGDPEDSVRKGEYCGLGTEGC